MPASAQSPHWINWTDVQITRQNAIKAYQAAPLSKKEAVLRDVLVIVLHSITCVLRASHAIARAHAALALRKRSRRVRRPPDRVGVVV